MDRRRALHVLGSGTLAGTALPGAVPRGLAALTARARDRDPTVLSPAQAALVAEVGELILPATDTPGARDAGVERFVDLMLAEQVRALERSAFLAGLDGLETECLRRFGNAFLGATPAERYLLAAERDAAAFAPAEGERPPDQRFWRQLKAWVLSGYYTSEVGALQELEHRIIPGTFEGCAPLRPRQEGR